MGRSIPSGTRTLAPSLAARTGFATQARSCTARRMRCRPSCQGGTWRVAKAIPTLRHWPVNLFTALAPHYRIFASIRFQRLCPPRACEQNAAIAKDNVQLLVSDLSLVWLHIVLPENLTEELPPVVGEWAEFGQAPAAPKPGIRRGREGWFAEFLSPIDRQPARMHVIHLVLPHMPFEYVPSGRRYSAPDFQGHQIDWEVFLFDEASAAAGRHDSSATSGAGRIRRSSDWRSDRATAQHRRLRRCARHRYGGPRGELSRGPASAAAAAGAAESCPTSCMCRSSSNCQASSREISSSVLSRPSTSFPRFSMFSARRPRTVSTGVR